MSLSDDIISRQSQGREIKHETDDKHQWCPIRWSATLRDLFDHMIMIQLLASKLNYEEIILCKRANQHEWIISCLVQTRRRKLPTVNTPRNQEQN